MKRPQREPNKFKNEGTERRWLLAFARHAQSWIGFCHHLHQGGNSTHLPARALDMIRKLLKVPNFHIVRADPHENSALLPLLAMPENGDTIAGERLVDLDAVAPSPRS